MMDAQQPQSPLYDPFVILGLLRSATDKEIKAAYRTKAKVLHPDVGGNAVEFDALQRAYETLTDPAKRQEWERTGQEPHKGASASDARQQQIITLLLLHLDSALDDEQCTTLREEMLRTLEEHLRESAKDEERCATALAKLQGRVARVKSEGLIKGLLRDKVRKLEEAIEHRRNEQSMVVEARGMVEEMEEEAPEAAPTSNPSDALAAFFEAIAAAQQRGGTFEKEDIR